MADKDESPEVESEDKTEDKDQEESPSDSQEDKEEKKTEAPLKIPEKLKDKSTQELVKMYGELEHKLGEQSATVAEAKKLKENQQLLAQAIYSKPDLTKQVEEAILEVSGEKPQEGDGEAKDKPSPETTDQRRFLENRIIAEFSAKVGLDKLDAEKRQDEMKKVGQALTEMLDPGGNKTVAQIMSQVSLDRLPKQLENAYWLANKDSLMDKGSLPLDTASIGRFSSSSGKSEPGEGLTERERQVAERLGVKPDDYLKQKQQLLKQ